MDVNARANDRNSDRGVFGSSVRSMLLFSVALVTISWSFSAARRRLARLNGQDGPAGRELREDGPNRRQVAVTAASMFVDTPRAGDGVALPSLPAPLAIRFSAKRARALAQSRLGESTALLFIVGAAAFLRFWRLRTSPGWEWDEPNYTNIATNLARHGDLAIKHDILTPSSVYLFHPPFYFYLLAGWFKLVGYGIFEARVLIALSSLVLVLLSYVLFRRRLGRLALIPAAALACDGWLVFSSRVAWFDQLMLVIGVVGLLVYERARSSGAFLTYAMAGSALGAAIVFKHVGAYLLLAVLIHWMLVGGNRRGHFVLFASAVGVVVLYVCGMFAVFGHDYWNASSVQFGRATGTWNSGGGSMSSASSAVRPLLHQYRLFYATIAVAVFGLLLLAVRIGRMIINRSRAPIAEIGITFSWLIAGLIFFSVLQIRFPQYFMMVLIPLYGYVAIEVFRWLPGRGRALTSVAILALISVLAADGATFQQRIVSRSDNALKAVAAFANQHIPSSDIVITEQPIGVLIRQPYCETWAVERCASRAKWIIYYRTADFEPQKAYKIKLLTSHALKVATFRGFKETISVYKLSN